MKTGSELRIPSKISLLKKLAGILWRDRSGGTRLGENLELSKSLRVIAIIKQLMQL
jgi:hypothetical protein